MNYQLCVLLYSKYSDSSKTLVSQLSNAPVDIKGLVKVCVDNEEIRDRIQKSTTVQIDMVPTLLLTYPNGGVEKYEGERAFLWFDQKIRELMKENSPPPQENKEEKDLEKIKNQIREQLKAELKKELVLENKPTSVEEVINSDDSQDVEEITPPPVGIRNGAGGYDITDSFGPQSERTIPNAANPMNAKPNLMQKAQAMQKERESASK